jgi:hypothetical protein
VARATISLVAALVGGLLGYGARIAYRCNIGVFGGIASASVHGWVWLVAALGNVVGTRVRPCSG